MVGWSEWANEHECSLLTLSSVWALFPLVFRSLNQPESVLSECIPCVCCVERGTLASCARTGKETLSSVRIVSNFTVRAEKRVTNVLTSSLPSFNRDNHGIDGRWYIIQQQGMRGNERRDPEDKYAHCMLLKLKMKRKVKKEFKKWRRLMN